MKPQKITKKYWEKYMDTPFAEDREHIFWTSEWVEHFGGDIQKAMKMAAKTYGLDPDRFSLENSCSSNVCDLFFTLYGAWTAK